MMTESEFIRMSEELFEHIEDQIVHHYECGKIRYLKQKPHKKP